MCNLLSTVCIYHHIPFGQANHNHKKISINHQAQAHLMHVRLMWCFSLNLFFHCISCFRFFSLMSSQFTNKTNRHLILIAAMSDKLFILTSTTAEPNQKQNQNKQTRTLPIFNLITFFNRLPSCKSKRIFRYFSK